MSAPTRTQANVDAGAAARLEEAADWFMQLRETQADETLFARWMDWCGADERNIQAYEQIKATWSVSGLQSDEQFARITSRPRNWKVSLATAASVLMLLTAGVLFYKRPGEPAATGQSLSTPVAMHSDGVLPDGSRVVLGAASRMSSHFSEKRRLVKVETGEAFFDVAKDPRRPFVVEAGDIPVTALGTAFNVRRGAGRIVVTVEEGLVEVAAASGPPARAGAGEQISYSVEDGRIVSDEVDPALARAWQQGVLKYVREPLADVVADLNRYSTRHITIADPALAQQRYTGTVFGNHVADWLAALETAFPVRVVEGEQGASIIPRE